MSEQTPESLGSIIRWPNGYAMTLGRSCGNGGAVRCCAGHETPEEAKSHGIVRCVEVALAAADRDVAIWTTTPPTDAAEAAGDEDR